MLTDHHPPLHFQQNGEMQGFGVDLVRELAKASGDSARIEREPLLRALADSVSAPDTGLFIIMRTAEREASYQWVGPVMVSESAFYGLGDPASPLPKLSDVRVARRIALPRKWLAYGVLQEQGFTNLYGVDTPEQMMRLLRVGRADLIVADTLTVATLAREAGIEPSQLQFQRSLMTQGAYIAFSRNTDPQVVARWQAALDTLRQDGRLQQMLQRWQLDKPLR
ncbi:transporter substrate-binding domain-containing protein [Pseudomonas sp. LFM046]|uniref:substrate-binding periplasmic protein n=1 Tax=Pseudomonas sp. LFM046 TaxID=1608357 RepID=UPI0032215E2D